MDVSRTQAEATRLLPLAERVLERYPFHVREVSHLATHSNVQYRVVTESGQQFVLRVGTPHANTRTNIDVEVAWLDALREETDLEVVRPIRSNDGTLIVDEHDEVLGKERASVLFSWVPGQPMGDGAGPFAYRLLGAMSASLQDHGKQWSPPRASRMRIWDEVFYYREEDPVVLHTPKYSHLFDMARLRTIEKAIRVSQDVIVDSYASGLPQVVHGDLHEWNAHLAGSRIHAFDFEDVMIALPEQDAAISLYSSRTSEIKTDIRAAFRRGFESIAEWPVADERQLDGFHAARQVMLMNYAARTLPVGESTDYLDRVMPWLDRYVERYA
jgi:Ser/Thr protein kinase RdoA (MazF antagonist)